MLLVQKFGLLQTETGLAAGLHLDIVVVSLFGAEAGWVALHLVDLFADLDGQGVRSLGLLLLFFVVVNSDGVNSLRQLLAIVFISNVFDWLARLALLPLLVGVHVDVEEGSVFGPLPGPTDSLGSRGGEPQVQIVAIVPDESGGELGLDWVE